MLKMITKVKIGKDGGEVYKDFPVDRLKFKRGVQKEEETPEELGEISD